MVSGAKRAVNHFVSDNAAVHLVVTVAHERTGGLTSVDRPAPHKSGVIKDDAFKLRLGLNCGRTAGNLGPRIKESNDGQDDDDPFARKRKKLVRGL
jgi:hypothetical protein